MRAIVCMAALAALGTAAIGCGGLPDCKHTLSSLGGKPESACGITFDREKGECIQKAQICPSLSPVNFCYRAEPYTTYVSLQNYGESDLDISKIEILGDTHCAYKVTSSIPVGQAVKGEKDATLAIAYTPQDAGTEDQVTVRVTSNAENFPVLLLELCGKSVAAGTTAPTDCGKTGGFLCKGAATETVMSCGT